MLKAETIKGLSCKISIDFNHHPYPILINSLLLQAANVEDFWTTAASVSAGTTDSPGSNPASAMAKLNTFDYQGKPSKTLVSV